MKTSFIPRLICCSSFAIGYCFLIPTLALAQTSAPALPTQAEIRGQLEAGEYPAALKNLARVLELKGPAATPYNRPELLLLRGECLLQTRQPSAAKAALDDAFKESIAAGDSVNAGNTLALATLFSKSTNMTYTPKKGGTPVASKPFSILDRTTRPDAYKALFDELLPDTKTKARAIMQGDSMTTLMSIARDAATLRALEKLAAGPPDPADPQKIAADLVNRANALVGNSLNQMNASAKAISNAANQVQAYTVEQADPVSGLRSIAHVGRRTGLTPAESQSLKSMQQTCTQITASLKELSVEFAVPENFKDNLAATAELQQGINGVLNDNYALLQHQP